MNEWDIKAGCTRIVWLFPKFIIKFPRLLFGIKQGMQANRNERNWWNWYKDSRMCPVWFSDPWGFVIVMPRASQPWVLNNRTKYPPEELWNIIEQGFFKGLPEDSIPENIGLLNDELVMLDYGALSFPPIKFYE